MPSNYQIGNAHEYIIVGNCVKHISNLKNTANKTRSLRRQVRLQNDCTDSMSVQQIIREHRYGDDQPKPSFGSQFEQIIEEKPLPSIEYEEGEGDPTTEDLTEPMTMTKEVTNYKTQESLKLTYESDG